jgi:hypothetical protein
MNHAVRIPTLLEPEASPSSSPTLVVDSGHSPIPSSDAIQRTVDGEDALPSPDERLDNILFAPPGASPILIIAI